MQKKVTRWYKSDTEQYRAPLNFMCSTKSNKDTRPVFFYFSVECKQLDLRTIKTEHIYKTKDYNKPFLQCNWIAQILNLKTILSCERPQFYISSCFFFSIEYIFLFSQKLNPLQQKYACDSFFFALLKLELVSKNKKNIYENEMVRRQTFAIR